MATRTCPRCATRHDEREVCPTCGYEPRHPGVLGAYLRAAGLLAKRPGLLLAFLVPAALQVATQGALEAFDAVSATTPTLPANVAGLAALFLIVWWFFVALALTTRHLHGTGAHARGLTGGMLRDSALAAALALVPLAAIVLFILYGPTGALSALSLLAIVSLALFAVFWSGRVVGIPVEAALHEAPPRATLRNGIVRGRENGGLGLTFLAFLLLAGASVVPVVLDLSGLTLAPFTIIVLGAALAWPIGAWSGVAMALALAPSEHARTTFACPSCGSEAVAEAGRARCSCGLEGAYYSG